MESLSTVTLKPHLATDNELVRNILLALLSSLARSRARKSAPARKREWPERRPRLSELADQGLRLTFVKKIAKRAAKGEKPYAIAKALGVDRHTAAKYAG
jgi:hypothetical protein